MAQLVEHILGKDEVPGPNPGSSSRRPRSNSFGALVFLRVQSAEELQPGTAPVMGTASLWEDLSPEESTGLFTVRIPIFAIIAALKPRL